MNKFKPGRPGLLVIWVALLLSGCGDDRFSDIKQWMADSTQNMRGKVEPLPEFKPYVPVPYAAFDLVDPFSRAKMVGVKTGVPVIPAELQNHIKETLEAFDLEKLRMVGTLERGKVMNALIRTPDGNLYRVKAGGFMGQNFGVVTKITETEVTLRETVEDSGGDWVERTRTLMLDETEQKK